MEIYDFLPTETTDKLDRLEYELTDEDKRLIYLMAKYNMNLSTVGRHVYAHRNTVTYWVDRFRSRTGMDMKSFYDLLGLIALAVEQEKERGE